MIVSFALVFLAAVSSPVSSGGFAAFVTAGGESVCVVDGGGETVSAVDAEIGERLSYPALSELRLVYVSSTRGLVEEDIISGESAVLSAERTGAPWFSSDGDLWYTFDGFLYKNGVSTGVEVPAFYVSVENGVAVFTDRSDRLHIVSLISGEGRVIQGLRYFSPVVLAGGDVVVSSLTGEIVFVPAGGEPVVVASGEQPCWSYRSGGVFFCVSSDDGHDLTAADLWFVKPGEEPVQVTFTEDILETKPACSGDLVWFLDAVADSPNCMRTDVSAL
ncbi:MAG: hypothetical protein B1H09_01105 [Gemmatimonadaceae bacterium 4484_173]|nr:MAG: hypothetical protein B1H09_01105 [Gemmatimonadaceae bacterium 4484_173]RKZ02454.1 MAG: hypothetical protein DRQ21_08625 [Candidatus Fermentibacteria bacterium]